MHRLSYYFNSYYLLFAFLILSCDDIPRDNLLDPKNPNSYRPQIISIEAFVNTQNSEEYNEYMLSALATIEQRYPGKVSVVHYHRNVGGDIYPDSLAISANEILYTQYVSYFDGVKGVPDVFINGAMKRIKGASSTNSALERLDNALQPILIENSFYTIEPKVAVNNTTIAVSAVIARLGSESAQDILLRATLVARKATLLNYPVVKQTEISNLIPTMEPGEQKEIVFSDFKFVSGADLFMIFTVSSSENHLIDQTIEVQVR